MIKKIVFALLIVLLMFSGCTNISKENNVSDSKGNDFENDVSSNEIKECLSYSDDLEKNSCLEEVGKKTGDIKACDSIQEKNSNLDIIKARCYSYVAEKTNSVAPCDKINTDDMPLTQADAQIHMIKRSCYDLVAELTENPEICENIANYDEHDEIGLDSESIQSCKNLASGDISKWCDTKENKDSCYFNFVKSKKDEKFCEYIKEIQTPNKVNQDTCYKEIAFSKKNFELCEKIQNNETKDLCYWEIATKSGNPEMCEYILNNKVEGRHEYSYTKDNCYLNYAKELSNENYCDKMELLEGDFSKDFCYYVLALQKQNKQICNKIVGQLKKEECYKRFGEEINKPQEYSVKVKANQQWTKTNLCVIEGRSVNVSATGSIQYSPAEYSQATPKGVSDSPPANGWPCNEARGVSLILKIGEQGQCFEIGENKTITAPVEGEIFLGVNDDYLGDNSGEWTAIILTQINECG
ncbi:MAG: LecA/PA-IL family lectin [Candidatus Micrarchaeota archaeon]